MKKYAYMLYALSLIALCYAVLSQPLETAFHVKSALRLCALTVIPSLYIYMVLASLMSELLICVRVQSRVSKLFSRIFNIEDVLLPVCIFGYIFGSPASTGAIGKLYSEGAVSKSGAQKAILITANCSSGFILSVLSALLSDAFMPALILTINILSSLTVYFLLFREKSENFTKVQYKKKSYSRISDSFCTSLSQSGLQVIKMCGFIVFFYVISSMVTDRITSSETASSFLKCFLEVSSGIISVSAVSCNISIVILSFATSFCGLSILLQIKSTASYYGLETKRLIFFKFLTSLVSSIYTVLALFLMAKFKMYCPSVLVENAKFPSGIVPLKNVIFIVCILFLVIVLSNVAKKHKN